MEKAVNDGANLNWASLVRANLNGASLDGASLDGANLNWASLDGANLNGASLDGASLVRANLDGASLDGANLNWASLVRASLVRASLDGASLSEEQMLQTYIPMYSKYCPMIKGDKIKIGCKEKTVAEWDSWFAGDNEYETKRTDQWFKRIQAHYEAVKAYKQFMDRE